MVISLIKIESLTTATRQFYAGRKSIKCVRRLLVITIDNKIRWDSHTDNVCKSVSRRVFLLSKLRYTDTRKLFFNAHIKPHTDYASFVWDGCSDVLKKRLNSLHRRDIKLIFADKTLSSDHKFKKDNEPTQTT